MGWERKEWYRFIMPIFLHAGFLHILMNLVAQLIIGSMIEMLLSSARSFTIYILSGIGGVLLGCLLSKDFSVGASGAIFGLCAAFVCLNPT